MTIQILLFKENKNKKTPKRLAAFRKKKYGLWIYLKKKQLNFRTDTSFASLINKSIAVASLIRTQYFDHECKQLKSEMQAHFMRPMNDFMHQSMEHLNLLNAFQADCRFIPCLARYLFSCSPLLSYKTNALILCGLWWILMEANEPQIDRSSRHWKIIDV